jgi:saccharopine dehydrogenase-like NADP-dependent oxidoreductase
MRFAVVGLGAVGTRVARQLVSSEMVVDVTLLDHDPARGERLADTLGPRAVPADSLEALDDTIDVVVLAATAGEHLGPPRLALARGWNVVSTSDNFEDVAGLLALHNDAVRADRLLVVGAAFSPGLSCVLARHASSWFDELTEVHVA